jgi:anoctamin-1
VGFQVVKSVAFQEIMPLEDVDFVLVWDGSVEQACTEQAKERRRIFEKNLEEEGLTLEREKLEACNLNFIKIHAPMEVLRRYSEILKLRMPMKQVRHV